MRASHLLILVVFLAQAGADDLTTTDGKTYRNVTIRKVEPDGLAITHEAGLAKVPFAKLSAELQKAHGYDPVKAEAYAKKQAEEQHAAEAQLAKELQNQAIQKAVEADNGADFEIVPAMVRRVSLTFVNRNEYLANVRARLEKEQRSKVEIDEELANQGPGLGYVLVSWTRSQLKDSDARDFQVIISDAAGNVMQREKGERSNFESVSGGWSDGMAVALEGLPPGNLKVRVIDAGGAAADFELRRKVK